MNDQIFGGLLLILALLFVVTYFLAGFFEKLKIPGILAALFTGMIIHYTHFNNILNTKPYSEIFTSLADIGVLFLLFFIGLEIDIKEMKSQSDDIIIATVLNTIFPFLFGAFAMLYLGYGWTVAFVVGLTRMPTAEAVIVPILDEFSLIKTKVGSYIVGAGVLDDVIEVFLVAFVSIWIGEKTDASLSSSSAITNIFINLFIFVSVAWLARKWILIFVSKWLQNSVQNLIFLMIITLFLFGGFAEYSDLGLVVGAIVAGMLMRPVFDKSKEKGESATKAVRAISYGFFGIIFFLWIGMSVDLNGMLKSPELAVILFLAAFFGKLIGIFSMVPMRKLTVKEAWIIGIGLNARLTTEIIVAKLLLDAKLIDTQLFTALVAASSVSTVIVPIAFTILVVKWKDRLTHNLKKEFNR